MADLSEERIKAIYDSFTQGGRDLAELRATNDKLKGAEAQRLRTDFTSHALDLLECENFHLAAAVMTGNLTKLKVIWEETVAKLGGGADGEEKAAKEWYEYKDGHNKLPIYDILLVGGLTEMDRSQVFHARFYEMLDWLIERGVGVEGTDIAGFTALQHSLGLTPLMVDYRFSETLLKASADPIAALNHKNRYGGTLMHGVTMNYRRPGEEKLRGEVLRWVMDRGANADVMDGDTSTPRAMTRLSPMLRSILNEYDQQNLIEKGCAFCRRGGVKGKGKVSEQSAEPPTEGEIKASSRCGKCRKASYCSAACQRMDWGHHKKSCKPTVVS